MDPTTYHIDHTGSIYKIQNLAAPATPAIEQGHDYKVGVAVKATSANN